MKGASCLPGGNDGSLTISHGNEEPAQPHLVLASQERDPEACKHVFWGGRGGGSIDQGAGDRLVTCSRGAGADGNMGKNPHPASPPKAEAGLAAL